MIMKVVKIRRNLEVMGQMRIVVSCRRSHFNSLAEMLRFLHGFLGPRTGVDVSGFLDEEVGRDLHELKTGTATEEDH